METDEIHTENTPQGAGGEREGVVETALVVATQAPTKEIFNPEQLMSQTTNVPPAKRARGYYDLTEGKKMTIKGLQALIMKLEERVYLAEEACARASDEIASTNDRVDSLETENAALRKKAEASLNASVKATTYAKAAQSDAGAVKNAARVATGLKAKTKPKPKKKPAAKAAGQIPSFCVSAPEGADAASIEAVIKENGNLDIRGVAPTTNGNFRVFHKGEETTNSEKIRECVTQLGEGYSELDTSVWFKRVYYMSTRTTPQDPGQIRLQLQEANSMSLSHNPVILRARAGANADRPLAVVVRFDTKEDEETASRTRFLGFQEVLPASRPYKNKPRNAPRHE